MNKPVYLSAPGIVCAAGSGRDALWSAVTDGNNSCIKKTSVQGKEFYSARIDECLLDKGRDLNSRFDMKIVRIELCALLQIEDFIHKAISLYGCERVGVCAGSCDNGSELSVASHREYFNTGKFPESYSLEVQGADYVATCIKERYGIEGPSLAFSTACSSSAGAIVKACQMIRSGEVDAVIAGGADIASDTVLLGFDSLEAVSPEKTNPFSRNRKGITLGDGAAFFVLSRDCLSLDDEVVLVAGYGESSDAYHVTSPDPEGRGAEKAMNAALISAGIQAESIDYLNLHGTGTHLNDSMEAKAVDRVFKDYKVPCSSTKSETGHTLGAAGALEAAVCYETIVRNGHSEKKVLPVQCWDGEKDEGFPELNIMSSGNLCGRTCIQYCMSNSFAFGGSNVSLILSGEAFVPQRIEGNALQEMLPHRGKMLLLSRVTGHNVREKTVTAEYDVTSDCIFYDDKKGGIPSWVGFEIMGQSVSALAAICRTVRRDIDRARTGVILSVSDFKSDKAVLENNSTVCIRVKEYFCADDVSQYDCVLYERDVAVITARITVMEIKDMKEKLCQKK